MVTKQFIVIQCNSSVREISVECSGPWNQVTIDCKLAADRKAARSRDKASRHASLSAPKLRFEDLTPKQYLIQVDSLPKNAIIVKNATQSGSIEIILSRIVQGRAGTIFDAI